MTGVELGAVQMAGNGASVRRLEGAVLALLLVFGLYAPTSSSGAPSKVLIGLDLAVCACLLCLLMLKRKDLPSIPVRIAILAIIPLLCVFTVTSGMHAYSFGELAAFVVLALLFMLNLRQVCFPKWLYHLFSIVNVVNITLGVGAFLASGFVTAFLSKFYAQFDEELVPMMLLMRKPVLSFAAHSLAGFFYFLFFQANFRTYQVRGRKFFLFVALCYLVLTAGLLSVTGLLMSVVGFAQVGFYFWRRLPRRRLALIGAMAIVLFVAGLGSLDPAIKQGTEIASSARSILLSQENGFLGRLGPNGTMYPALRYVKEHPFSPLGLSRNDNLLVGDMGLLDYFIRGSLPLVLWAYGGLFLLLKRSLSANWDLWFLFGVILAFETGFSVLAYFRLQYLLPFFIVYFNDLRRYQALNDRPDMQIMDAAA